MKLSQDKTTPYLNCTLCSSSPHGHAKDVVQVKSPPGEFLEISFQRTIRVPDGKGESELPPSMGTFPLYSIAQYHQKLPHAMAVKGGLFLPMYRKSLPSNSISSRN